jgi:hypothetical protein
LLVTMVKGWAGHGAILPKFINAAPAD